MQKFIEIRFPEHLHTVKPIHEARHASFSLWGPADAGFGQLPMALCEAPSCTPLWCLSPTKDAAVTCLEPYLRQQNASSALSSATSFLHAAMYHVHLLENRGYSTVHLLFSVI